MSLQAPPGPAQAQGEPLLTARGLSVGQGHSPFVHDLDLAVAPGEIVALLGANGAGKTTTLMALAGYLRPARGRVEFAGTDSRVGMDALARQGLAVVTQDRCIFTTLSVRDNLRLGRGPIDDALHAFPELREHMARKAGLLSGGQQQMLAVARALAGRPKVLLADEVALGLAPKIVERLLSAIHAAAKREGMAVVLVDDHVVRALRYADRAVVLQRGRVGLSGTTSELSARRTDIAALYL